MRSPWLVLAILAVLIAFMAWLTYIENGMDE